jgi:hypothetical protein
VSVSYATANGTAVEGTDYAAASGALVVPAGQTAAQIAVAVRGDRIFEPSETLAVTLSGPLNGVLADALAAGTILDDDAAGFSVDDVTVTEPLSGTRMATFTVTLSPTSPAATSVQIATGDGTATSPGDFASTGTTLAFAANASTRTFPVTINADAVKEAAETFTVTLATPTGGPAIGFGNGVGRIVDPGRFHTVTPCRAADTRAAEGPALGPGADRLFAVVGRCGVPTTARAASVNVTVTQATQGGDLRLYAAGAPLSLASVINYGASQTRANNAIVPLGAAGQIAVHLDQAAGSVHFILDVNGYVE